MSELKYRCAKACFAVCVLLPPFSKFKTTFNSPYLLLIKVVSNFGDEEVRSVYKRRLIGITHQFEFFLHLARDIDGLLVDFLNGIQASFVDTDLCEYGGISKVSFGVRRDRSLACPKKRMGCLNSKKFRRLDKHANSFA